MSHTKFKSPENCGGLGHQGVSYLPDEDGVTTFPVELTALAISHGYEPIEGSGFIDPSTVVEQPQTEEVSPKVDESEFSETESGVADETVSNETATTIDEA